MSYKRALSVRQKEGDLGYYYTSPSVTDRQRSIKARGSKLLDRSEITLGGVVPQSQGRVSMIFLPCTSRLNATSDMTFHCGFFRILMHVVCKTLRLSCRTP